MPPAARPGPNQRGPHVLVIRRRYLGDIVLLGSVFGNLRHCLAGGSNHRAGRAGLRRRAGVAAGGRRHARLSSHLRRMGSESRRALRRRRHFTPRFRFRQLRQVGVADARVTGAPFTRDAASRGRAPALALLLHAHCCSSVQPPIVHNPSPRPTCRCWRPPKSPSSRARSESCRARPDIAAAQTLAGTRPSPQAAMAFPGCCSIPAAGVPFDCLAGGKFRRGVRPAAG